MPVVAAPVAQPPVVETPAIAERPVAPIAPVETAPVPIATAPAPLTAPAAIPAILTEPLAPMPPADRAQAILSGAAPVTAEEVKWQAQVGATLQVVVPAVAKLIDIAKTEAAAGRDPNAVMTAVQSGAPITAVVAAYSVAQERKQSLLNGAAPADVYETAWVDTVKQTFQGLIAVLASAIQAKLTEQVAAGAATPAAP